MDERFKMKIYYYLIIIFTIIFIYTVNCSEDSPPPLPEKTEYTKFKGYDFDEDFSTSDYVNTELSEGIDFTPSKSVPSGEGTLVTKPIIIDSNFYQFDRLTIYFSGDLTSIKFYNQSIESAEVFQIDNPIGQEEIILTATNIVTVSNLVIVFEMTENCSIQKYNL